MNFQIKLHVRRNNVSIYQTWLSINVGKIQVRGTKNPSTDLLLVSQLYLFFDFDIFFP